MAEKCAGLRIAFAPVPKALQMIVRFMPVLLLIGGLLAASPAAAQQIPTCPPSMPRAERAFCLTAALPEAEAALAVARRDETKAIADWSGNVSPADREQWALEFGRMLDLWTSLRDQLCAPALLGFENGIGPEPALIASQACRLNMSRVIVADLTNRFGEALPDLGRSSFVAAGRGPNRRELIAAEGSQPLCRHPGRGGDYAPLTECYQRHAARVDRELNGVWGQVLAAIRGRTDLAQADRTAWTEALRTAQRSWVELRDLACNLEAYETPNRFANSIYSGLTGPCLIVETEARTRTLRQVYRLR
jgi:uncharacterized protein YecT (DUF1311 family)